MTNLKPWHWQQVSIGGVLEILENDTPRFYVHFEKTAEKIVSELNTQADTIASLQAENESLKAEALKSQKYSANLTDSIRQHLVMWNHFKTSNRQENAIILATDTNEAMLSILDNINADFSMTWAIDAFTSLENVLNGDDGYFIKVYKEALNERVYTLDNELTEARAKIANLQKVIADSKAYDTMITDGSDESTAPEPLRDVWFEIVLTEGMYDDDYEKGNLYLVEHASDPLVARPTKQECVDWIMAHDSINPIVIDETGESADSVKDTQFAVTANDDFMHIKVNGKSIPPKTMCGKSVWMENFPNYESLEDCPDCQTAYELENACQTCYGYKRANDDLSKPCPDCKGTGLQPADSDYAPRYIVKHFKGEGMLEHYQICDEQQNGRFIFSLRNEDRANEAADFLNKDYAERIAERNNPDRAYRA